MQTTIDNILNILDLNTPQFKQSHTLQQFPLSITPSNCSSITNTTLNVTLPTYLVHYSSDNRHNVLEVQGIFELLYLINAGITNDYERKSGHYYKLTVPDLIYISGQKYTKQVDNNGESLTLVYKGLEGSFTLNYEYGTLTACTLDNTALLVLKSDEEQGVFDVVQILDLIRDETVKGCEVLQGIQIVDALTDVIYKYDYEYIVKANHRGYNTAKSVLSVEISGDRMFKLSR